MILSVQRQVHDAISDGDPAPVRPRRGAAVRDRGAAEPRARRSRGHRSPSSWRARCARRRGRSRRSWPRRSAPIPGVARIVAAPERLPEPLSRSPRRSSPRAPAARSRRAAPPADKTIVEHTAINPNKAAHIGHLRNAALGDTLVRVAALPRHAGRSRRTTSTTPASRSPTSSSASASSSTRRSTRSARSPTRRASTTTAGISTRGSPSGTTATRRAWRSAPRRCTTSSTAATTPPRSARSSSTASSART